jgi:hypothetical protein
VARGASHAACGGRGSPRSGGRAGRVSGQVAVARIPRRGRLSGA